MLCCQLIAAGHLYISGRQQVSKFLTKGLAAVLNLIKSIVTDDAGAVYTEYALLAVLIAIAAVVAVGLFGESVLTLFESFPLSVFD